MDGNSKPQHAFTKPPLLEGGSESGYANMPVTKVPGSHGTIALWTSLDRMATGLFLAAAVSELAAPAVFTGVAKWLPPVALVLLLVDLGLLVFDLGDPLRFHHMLRVFKLGSPMSLGTWCLTIFSLPLTAAATLSLLAELGMDFESARMLAVVVGCCLASALRPTRASCSAQTRNPVGRTRAGSGGYLTNSALLMGCAELLVLSALMGQTQATAILRTAFIALLVLNVIPLSLLFANLRPAHARLYSREQQWRVGVLIAAGTVIPLVLMLLNGDLLFILVAVIVLLSESWVIRFVYVKIPHTSPLDVRSGE